MRKIAAACYALLFLMGVACALAGGGNNTPPPQEEPAKPEIKYIYLCHYCGDFFDQGGKCTQCNSDLEQRVASSNQK